MNANDDQLDPGVSVPGSGSAARNEVANNCAITTLDLANDNPDMSGIENTSGMRYFYRTNNAVGNAQFFDLVSDDYRIRAGTTRAQSSSVAPRTPTSIAIE